MIPPCILICFLFFSLFLYFDRCSTDLEITKILKGNFEHNHEKPDLEKSQLQERCKKRALENPDERPSKIIIRELKPGKIDIIPKEMASIRQAIYTKRKSIRPNLPKSRDETIEILTEGNFDQPEDLIVSIKEQVVLVTFKNNFTFCSLPDATFFGDGTFKAAPQHFFQLYTIHTEHKGYYLPLFFFLLPDKKASTYKTMINLLLEQCIFYGHSFDPKNINLDFETATHQAFKESFPDINITGCSFHLKQAWLRKCGEIGLKKEYEDTEGEIHRWLRTVFGMSFLNPENVEDFFAFELCADAPQDKRIEAFTDYLLLNYISPHSQFPPIIWASNDVAKLRTTNCCENFHSKLNTMFSSAHPNIFNLIQRLGEMQKHTLIKINGIQKNEPPRQRHRHIEKKRRLENNTKDLNSGIITPIQFVRRMSYKFF